MQDVQGVGGAGRKLRLALHSLTKAQSCFKKFRPQVTVTLCCWVLGMLPVPPAGLHPVSPLLVGRLEQGQQSQNQMQVCPSLVLALPIEWAASRLRPSFTPSSRKYAEDPPGPRPLGSVGSSPGPREKIQCRHGVNGNPLQYSCLENPKDRGAWWAAVHAVAEESDTTERLHFHVSLSCIGEGNGNLLQCSCLENPRDGGAWWAAISGLTQNRT